jgi:ATP-dependent Lon protease
MDFKQCIIVPVLNNVVLPYEKNKIIIDKKWQEYLKINNEIVLGFYKKTSEESIILNNQNNDETGEFISKYGTLCKIIEIDNTFDEFSIIVEAVERVLILRTFLVKDIFYGDINRCNPILNKDSYKIFNNLRVSILDILHSMNEEINLYKYLTMLPIEFFYSVIKELSKNNIDYKLVQLEENDIINGLKSLYQIYFHLNKKFKEEVEDDIYDKFKKNIEELQKNYLLNEQMKTIKKELDKNNPNGDDNLDEEIKKHTSIPENIKKILLKEYDKIKNNNVLSTEYTITKNYITTSLSLPWGKFSQLQDTGILEAAKILDEDHYGLYDVKNNILEYLATAFKTKQTNVKVLLLIGPPGVGKTSIGESISKCLKRKFLFISLNSITDIADLVGHRRTYVGAYPGQIINKIIESGIMNPLIFLDEVDKIKNTYNNPTNVLVSLLDPTQNNNFTDNFLGYGIDLSKCIFILTANSLDNLPDYLLSRMEIIYIDGYSIYEKVEIVKRFLLPKIYKNLFLKEDEIIFKEEAILYIIKHYTMEMGVRSLNKLLNNIISKYIYFNMKNEELLASNVEINKDDEISKEINISNIKKYINKKEIDFELNLQSNEIIGLAWTSVGGSVLKIQAFIYNTPGKGDFILTGKLGDVMKESSKVAFTLIKNNSLLMEYGLKEDFFINNSIHIHVPEGAVPKDGPSAGVTLYSSLFLTIKNKLLNENKIAPYIGMTGEISLNGEVMAIGGVKQKILGAYMYGVKEVILPNKNRYDFEILKNMPTDIIVHFIKNVNELIDIMFKGN